jgi:hypothetical protein
MNVHPSRPARHFRSHDMSARCGCAQEAQIRLHSSARSGNRSITRGVGSFTFTSMISYTDSDSPYRDREVFMTRAP